LILVLALVLALVLVWILAGRVSESRTPLSHWSRCPAVGTSRQISGVGVQHRAHGPSSSSPCWLVLVFCELVFRDAWTASVAPS
tara:strand:+ start:1123 stop:1374 length:252 start_codon:yes stop_codon:yes gene_type:complete